MGRVSGRMFFNRTVEVGGGREEEGGGRTKDNEGGWAERDIREG